MAIADVSVCIPTYNRAGYLAECLESVLRQTHRDLEVLVVDNCSTDATADVVRKFTDGRVRYLRNERNLGQIGNLNRCLEVAAGEYVCIFHDDDLYHPRILEEELAVFARHPRVGLVHSAAWLLTEDGYIRKLHRVSPQDYVRRGEHAFVDYLRRSHDIVFSTVMIRRRCYDAVGRFNPAYMCADFDMWLRMALHGDIAYLAAPLAGYRMHAASASRGMDAARWFGEYFAIFDGAMALGVERVPGLRERASELRVEAQRHQARRARMEAAARAAAGDFTTALGHVAEAERMDPSRSGQLCDQALRAVCNRPGELALRAARAVRTLGFGIGVAVRGGGPVVGRRYSDVAGSLGAPAARDERPRADAPALERPAPLSSSVRPRVSVITCVHNGERYLARAIESILGQTFDDFEYWIVDDASTDGSPAVLDAYRHDPRLHVLRTERNTGAYQAANLALAHVRGEYVARMDADDVSLSERLALQVDYLDRHPAVALVGSRYQPIDERGKRCGAPGGTISDPRELRWMLLFRNPIAHSTVMYRRALVEQLGGYGAARLSQDYDLWARISAVAEVAQLSAVTVHYRIVESGLTATRWAAQRAASAEVSRRALAGVLGRPADDAEILTVAQRYYGLDDCSPAEVRPLVDFVISLAEPFCRRFGYVGADRAFIQRCAYAVVLWAVRNKETDEPRWALAVYLRLLARNPRSPGWRRVVPALGKVLVGARFLRVVRRLKTAVVGRRLSVREGIVIGGRRA